MSQIKTDRSSVPVDQEHDPEVLAFRAPLDDRNRFDELVREGAKRMLQAAIDAEVEVFIAQHADRPGDSGRSQVAKNGSLPSRENLAEAGLIEVKQGRVRDDSPDADSRVQFVPSVLPACLRRTDAIQELIPWIYLKGISTSDFGKALQVWRLSVPGTSPQLPATAKLTSGGQSIESMLRDGQHRY